MAGPAGMGAHPALLLAELLDLLHGRGHAESVAGYRALHLAAYGEVGEGLGNERPGRVRQKYHQSTQIPKILDSKHHFVTYPIISKMLHCVPQSVSNTPEIENVCFSAQRTTLLNPVPSCGKVRAI